MRVTDVAAGGDALYIADRASPEDRRIDKVDADGTLTTVAGGVDEEYPFDRAMTDVERGTDGNVYVAAGGAAVRMYPDGATSVVAGGNWRQQAYDGQLASTVVLGNGLRIASGPDGAMYLGDAYSSQVYELGEDGSRPDLADRCRGGRRRRRRCLRIWPDQEGRHGRHDRHRGRALRRRRRSCVEPRRRCTRQRLFHRVSRLPGTGGRPAGRDR